MSSAKRQTKTNLCRAAGAFVALGLVGACDGLLDVDLPDAVTESALQVPSTAPVQVNSIMASFECGYSGFALRAGGYEDNFQRYSGVAGLYSEYDDTPDGGNCDSGAAFSSSYMDAFLIARAQGKQTYERISNWTDAEVDNRQALLAQTALYTALPLDIFGEFFCEMTVDGGPLMTPTQTLNLAEEWVNTALEHVAATGDFPIVVQQGTITPSIEDMAYGLRARIRWSRGDLAAAAADAALIPDGFVAWVLREPGEDRRNTVAVFASEAQQAAGFLQGPVRLKTGDLEYGVTALGNNPITGQPWPSTLPFTGYLNLAIDASTGRAVTDGGFPITTATAGTVADTRVQHTIANTTGGPDNVVLKYDEFSDDIPLINWKEMRLIQAQYANEQGDRAAAVAFVNDVRAADDLPLVQGSYLASALGSADVVEDMIIEERRRALWLEGRFWSTKIQNTDKLWFPRRVGDWINNSAQYVLYGGVRLLMQEDEYQINENLTLADRATGCSADQAPVFN